MSYRSAINVQCSNCEQVGLLYWEDELEWKKLQTFLEKEPELPDDIEAPFFECGSCGEIGMGTDGESSVILR